MESAQRKWLESPYEHGPFKELVFLHNGKKHYAWEGDPGICVDGVTRCIYVGTGKSWADWPDQYTREEFAENFPHVSFDGDGPDQYTREEFAENFPELED